MQMTPKSSQHINAEDWWFKSGTRKRLPHVPIITHLNGGSTPSSVRSVSPRGISEHAESVGLENDAMMTSSTILHEDAALGPFAQDGARG
jgi:hypothetical protein